MNSTLGGPSLARRGSGQAWLDTSIVRPMTPLNAVPGTYSFNDILVLLPRRRPVSSGSSLGEEPSLSHDCYAWNVWRHLSLMTGLIALEAAVPVAFEGLPSFAHSVKKTEIFWKDARMA